VIERGKFAAHLTVTAGVPVCVLKNGYYVSILPNLVEDSRRILPGQFVFQQDVAAAHTPILAQNWISRNCTELVRKDE